MKKFIVASLIALTSLSYAKGSSHPIENLDQSSSRVAFSESDRVLIFGAGRTTFTNDGRLLVCPHATEFDWRSPNVCNTPAGVNNWQLIQNALPGYVLKFYEIRLAGSSGSYVTYILYFRAK